MKTEGSGVSRSPLAFRRVIAYNPRDYEYSLVEKRKSGQGISFARFSKELTSYHIDRFSSKKLDNQIISGYFSDEQFLSYG